MALFDDNLTGFLQSQFGRRYGDEENPLLANNPIFKNWMDDLQFKRMSNVFANTLGGADTSRPAAPINPTDYGNITTAPMRPAAVIPVATPVATPAVAAMPAPALSESGLGTVARSIPPVWAQEMMKAKQAADQPLNEGQKDALRYAALAKENAILDRQKRQDEANFDMYNPVAKVTQLHMMPHIPGTFGTGVMSSTPIFDNSKQRALEAERLQEGQTAKDWAMQAMHQNFQREMVGAQNQDAANRLAAEHVNKLAEIEAQGKAHQMYMAPHDPARKERMQRQLSLLANPATTEAEVPAIAKTILSLGGTESEIQEANDLRNKSQVGVQLDDKGHPTAVPATADEVLKSFLDRAEKGSPSDPQRVARMLMERQFPRKGIQDRITNTLWSKAVPEWQGPTTGNTYYLKGGSRLGANLADVPGMVLNFLNPFKSNEQLEDRYGGTEKAFTPAELARLRALDLLYQSMNK